MLSKVVCYLERAAGGAVFRKVRLLGPGVDRTWTAPELPGGASPDAPPAMSEETPGSVVGATKSAARWVADSVASLGVKRLGAVCVDPDGSVCTWLSAPSPDTDVISAVLAQGHAAQDGYDASGGGGGAGRVFALSGAGAPGAGDASVQALALADPEPAGAGNGVGALSKRLSRSSAVATSGRRQRFAVLAIPDAPVRVFLDELDSRNIEVDAVLTLWHALAAAWDPGLERPGPGAAAGRVVSSDSPSSAVLLVEPLPGAARLVWAWSRAGELIAGGSMRLRTVAWRTGPAAPDPGAAPGPTATEDPILALTARRIGDGDADAGPADSGEAVEFTDAEAGRLAMDWLAWSAQLGQCPERVLCIGPAALGGASAGDPAVPDPGTIGRALARVWPGATVDVAVHDDPLELTLGRLSGPGPALETSGAPVAPAGNPRAALVGLSNRPGRAHRSMYTWAAAGLLGLALLVGVLGWRLHGVGGTVDGEIADAKAKRAEAFAALENADKGLVNISRMPPKDAQTQLETRIGQLTAQSTAIKPPKPMLQELARVVAALEPELAAAPPPETTPPAGEEASGEAGTGTGADPPAGGAKPALLALFEINKVSARVTLNVPDAETGPRVFTRIEQTSGAIPWKGTTPFTRPGGQRQYLLSGSWAVDTTRTGAAPAAGGQ